MKLHPVKFGNTPMSMDPQQPPKKPKQPLPSENKKATQRKWLNKLMVISLVFILFMLLSQSIFARSLSVKTDRNEIEMGDIITLIIETDFQTFDSPDFTLLHDQFEVLGHQRSSQISITNGNFQAFSRWDVSLTPKHAGQLVIPPLSVSGVSSEPYSIKVNKFNTNKQDKGLSFLESSVNITDPYVQQEVIFTLRFHYQGQLIDGNIRTPDFGEAISKKLRHQVNYRKQISGRIYEVFEWSWAIFPQKSGKLLIPQQNFDGRVQYNSHIKVIKDRSNTIEINVLPQNSQYPQDKIWLPAKKILLSEEWQKQSPLRVGDSISRKIVMNARSLMASQLPDLTFEDQPGYHIYPGQTQNENRKTDEGVISQKSLELAVVLTQAGEITFPKIEIPWWNTLTQQMELAVLPEKTITVLPALNNQTLPKIDPLQAEVSRETELSVSPVAPSVWIVSTLILGSLWLITLWFLWQQRKFIKQLKAKSKQESTGDQEGFSSGSPEALEQICQINDAKKFYQAINRWMQQHPLNQTEAFEQALQNLKSHLYHGTDLAEDSLQALCNELKQQAVTAKSSKVVTGRQLDALYPR